LKGEYAADINGLHQQYAQVQQKVAEYMSDLSQVMLADSA
jgi:hypothetical protein